MHRHALRFAVCASLLLRTASVLSAQAPAPPNIYDHFIGTWIGSDVYMKDGVSRRTNVQIVITETKKKDQLRLEYVYGQKGTPDFDRGTRFLKLDPAKAKFELRWEGSSKETYKATGLDEFAKSGFGKFTGTEKTWYESEQDRVFRVVFELTNDTLRYEWQQGPDENHLVFRSIFALNRSAAVASQP